jgi:hypothetical protein
MIKDEALRLALEALKTIDEAMPFPVAKLAIKECKAALEAKDEPIMEYPNYVQGVGWRNVTPPQRTWVGLTDEEILKNQDIVENSYSLDLIEFARAIEAKLKEKNA